MEDYEDPEVENERLPVAKKQPLKFHMNDVSFQVNSSQLNDTGSHLYGASGEVCLYTDWSDENVSESLCHTVARSLWSKYSMWSKFLYFVSYYHT